MNGENRVRLMRLAGWCAYASGVVAIFGIVFLILLYVGIFTENQTLQLFGPMNDISVIVQYALTMPLALALHQRLKSSGPILSGAGLLIGFAGMIATIILQAMLVTGMVAFAQQVGLVMVAMLVVGVWILIVSHLGRRSGDLPVSVVLGVLAILYIGYPVWAFRIGRRLLEGTRLLAAERPVLTGEPG